MPTAISPASPRQISLLATLVDERRNTPAAADLIRQARPVLDDPAYTERREVSRLIDGLIAIRVNGAAAPAARSNDGDAVPAPSAATRAGRMLAAGSIEATVQLADGRHVTLSVRSRTRSGRGWTNASLLESGARSRISVLGQQIGWLTGDAVSPRVVLRTRREEYRLAVAALFAYAAGNALPTGVYRVQEASRCGRCFRTLTDPVSIDRGIGPECYGRGTGSTHVNRDNSAPVADLPGAPTEADANAFLDAAVAVVRAEPVRTETITRVRPEPSLTDLAAVAASPVLSGDQQRARDLIAEALDAYCGDVDRDFAMRIFDQLAAR